MQIYKIRRIRTIIVKLRAFVLIRILGRLKTSMSKDAFEVTISHNKKGLYQCNDRVNLLVKPLTAIEKINKDSKILVIGPRNEHDLYLLNAQGIKFKNIIGLDLMTYSSRIKIGDMHNMDFPDNSFDAVVFGWTLGYSSNPQKAIDEVIRVCKDKGLVAVGQEYSAMSEEEVIQLLGYNIQENQKLNQRINSTEQIINLFGNRINHVYFNHDAPLKRHHTKEGLIKNVSNIGVIVEVNKIA